MNDIDALAAAVRGAPSVEVAWAADDGGLQALSEPAVVDGSEVVMHLTAEQGAVVASLAGGRGWVLSVTDGRGAAPAWRPAAARVDVRAGALSTAWLDGPLLARLCARDPATRDLVGSPLLRREHWWAVPRYQVRATVTEVLPAPHARGDDEWVLVRDDAATVVVVGVTPISGDGHVGAAWAAQFDADVLAVRTAPPSGPGAERVEVLRGRLRRGRLVDAHRSGRIEARPGALLARWRAERRLARVCSQALVDWAPPP